MLLPNFKAALVSICCFVVVVAVCLLLFFGFVLGFFFFTTPVKIPSCGTVVKGSNRPVASE